MKKLILAFFSVVCLITLVRSQNGTCTPPVGVDCVTTPMYIDSVWTTSALIDFTNNATDCNTQDQDYQDYQNKIVTENATGSFVLHVGLNPSMPAYTGVWIDWNDDLTFGSGEQVFLSSTAITHTTVVVNVPNISPDTLIMRVRSANISMGPCDSVTSGETEDYRVVVIDASGVKEWEGGDWSFYPNPVNDVLNVSSAENSPADISIIDVAGKVVREMRSADGNATIDVSDLSPGMYFLQCTSGRITSTKKFVR